MKVLGKLVVLVLSVAASVAIVSDAVSAPPLPYPVMGRVLDPSGGVVAAARITVKNVSTGETVGPFAVRQDGVYMVDLSSLPHGWAQGQTVTISAGALVNGQSLSGSYSFGPSTSEWSAGGHQEDINMTVNARLKVKVAPLQP